MSAVPRIMRTGGPCDRRRTSLKYTLYSRFCRIEYRYLPLTSDECFGTVWLLVDRRPYIAGHTAYVYHEDG